MVNRAPESIDRIPSQNPGLRIALFSADAWEHVCPVVRWRGPAEAAGHTVVQGAAWKNGKLQLGSEKLAGVDLVVIQRDFPRYIETYQEVIAWARVQLVPVVYELDDLLTDLPENHPDQQSYRTSRIAILAAAAQADVVTCPTIPLQTALKRYQPNVFVLPNLLDDRLWKLTSAGSSRSFSEKDPLVIGYMGSPSHAPDLEMVAPVLRKLLDRYGMRVLLRLWGARPPSELIGLANVEWLDPGLVSYADFAAYFSRQRIDLAIAPLADTPFNRCKSAIKFLEYSALGVPGVYSQLPPYEAVVQQNENGLLAADLKAWENQLGALIEDRDLRYRLGQAAQESVRRDWLLSKQGAAWDRSLRTVLAACQSNERSTRLDALVEDVLRRGQEDQVLFETIPMLKTRLQTLEAENIALRDHLAAQQKTESSPTWRLFKLADAVRLKALPPGSRREKPFRWFVGAAFRMKRGPLAPLFHRLVPERFAGIPQVREPVRFEIGEGQPGANPAISLVVEQNPLLPEPDLKAVQAWVGNQTLRDTELVIWDSLNRTACSLTGETRSWQAEDLEELCEQLAGGYVCMASPDLLAQSRTYLEVNLAALVGEKLAFTVNALGPLNWPARHLERGRLPGSRVLPLFRLVARKDCLKNGFRLDLAACLEDGKPDAAVAGKILTHTTAHPEHQAAYPFETAIGDVEATLRGSYILVRKPEQASLPWPEEIPAQPGLALHRTLPLQPEPADLPTVLMVMPFLAVGGAEQIHLQVVKALKGRVRFVIFTVDPLDPDLGTTTEAFAQITPWVYNLPDFLAPELKTSFLWCLIERFQPASLYMASGVGWVYNLLGEIKSRYPNLRLVDQVYDYQMGWINRYDARTAGLMDGCIGVNEKIGQAYRNKGVPAGKVHVIENGVETDQLNPADYPTERLTALREKLGLPAQGKVVTFASRLNPQKRPVDFVELARRMADNPAVSFLMVGDGPLAAAVDGQIRQVGLSNIVRHGFYRPISDILAVTDVLVLPSEFEGMPMIVAEAQAMGKPVVVTDVGNNREVLELTQGGVVVSRPGDIGGLMQGVNQMLDCPPDPVRLREVVARHYGMPVVAEKYQAVLTGHGTA